MSETKPKKRTKASARKRWPRTIAAELHEQWQKMTRQNDAKDLTLLLKVSKPTIDRALIYGHVNQQRLIDGINQFFENRLTKEKEQVERFKELNPKP